MPGAQVTTPVGAEGMTWEDAPPGCSPPPPQPAAAGAEAGAAASAPPPLSSRAPWGGRFRSTTAAGLAADTAALYADPSEWAAAAAEGSALLSALYEGDRNLGSVVSSLEAALGELEARRGRDFPQAALWQNRRAAARLSPLPPSSVPLGTTAAQPPAEAQPASASARPPPQRSARATEYFSRFIEMKERLAAVTAGAGAAAGGAPAGGGNVGVGAGAAPPAPATAAAKPGARWPGEGG